MLVQWVGYSNKNQSYNEIGREEAKIDPSSKDDIFSDQRFIDRKHHIYTSNV